jgi:aspartyl aminopeptidase
MAEEKLLLERKHVAQMLSSEEVDKAFSYAKDYIDFISRVKTERESVDYIKERAEAQGFREGDKDKGYFIYKNKFIALWKKGKRPISEGLRIIASHIDTPRLDLKLNPFFEDFDLAFLKTHYYGGIKKYHWVAMPLALHGVVVKKDGTLVKVVIGEDDSDPLFTICDLLPHLARKKQEEKKLSEAILAENLNILVGGIPKKTEEEKKEEKEKVKKRVLELLFEKYGLTEEDFASAEVCAVPAGRARFIGFDRAFIGGYGQDDRICAYTSLTALLEVKEPEYTSLAIFMDREEIGSEGNTSAKSRVFEKLVYELIKMEGLPTDPVLFFEVMEKTKAISADVTAGIDPNYLEVHDKLNDARLGYGVVLTRYTGHGGKYMANEAHAEYVSYLRRIWDEEKVVYQVASMGKVDEGGGGTVAKYFAQYGMDIVDVGPPLLSMHSPFEVSHVLDLYMTYLAYKVFFSR